MRIRVAVALAATALAVAVPAAPALARMPAAPGQAGGAGTSGVAGVPAADTVREMQWHLDAINAPQAHQLSRGDGVVVAVIDSGVDAGHPDFGGAVVDGASFDNSRSQAGRTDPTGHGTRMAGLIAARGGGPNNALGIAPGASIISVAVSTDGTIDSMAEPIEWAVDHGAKVINISLARPSGVPQPPGEAEAIAAAIARDVVVVVAIGNRSDLAASSALADVPGVIAVAGTARSGAVYQGSLPGPRVAVAAPAEEIVTVGERQRFSTGYSVGSGTSESTAIVSGVAALIRARFPDLDAANVVNRIVGSAVDAGPAGRDEQFGFGVVDAERALSTDIPTVAENPLGVAPPPGPGTTLDAGGAPEATISGGRAALLIGLLVGALLCLGLVIGMVAWLVARSRRDRPAHAPPPYAGQTAGPPQSHPPASPPQHPRQRPPQQPPR
jgi:type VII secretion-associated serine protease mycosin